MGWGREEVLRGDSPVRRGEASRLVRPPRASQGGGPWAGGPEAGEICLRERALEEEGTVESSEPGEKRGIKRAGLQGLQRFGAWDLRLWQGFLFRIWGSCKVGKKQGLEKREYEVAGVVGGHGKL